MDAIFLSPPWGGTGYNLLAEYSLSHIYPDFQQMISKSLEFSHNMMLFLPKNTDIDDLVERLLPFSSHFQKDNEYVNQRGKQKDVSDLIIEIEQLYYGDSCKALLICTGKLAKIDPKEIVNYFYNKFCSKYDQSEEYLKIILNNIFTICGYN